MDVGDDNIKGIEKFIGRRKKKPNNPKSKCSKGNICN